jgi:hypothetical protein
MNMDNDMAVKEKNNTNRGKAKDENVPKGS